MNRLIFSTLLSMLIFACEEKNPYSGSGVAKNQQASANNNQNANANGQASAENIVANDPAATEAAAEEELSEEEMSVTALVCQNHPEFADFAEEMAVICTGGKPTNVFIQTLDNAFTGQGPAVPNVLVSEDNAGVSKFVVINAIEVNQTIDQVFQQRAAFNQRNFTAGNATVVQTELSYTEKNEGKLIGTAESQMQLNVSVAIINVSDITVLTIDYFKMDEKSGMIGVRSTLKANDPENADNILAKQVSFWIPGENSTKLLLVAHQQVNNQNRHATADQTIRAVGAKLMTETTAIFGQ